MSIEFINLFKNRLDRYFNKSNLVNNFNKNYKLNYFINRSKEKKII